MGQAHNLQGRLFSATPYFRQSIPATPAPEDPDDAFMRRLGEREDRGTHLRMFEQAGVLARSYSSENEGRRSHGDFVANKLAQAHREIPTGSGHPASPGENTTYESVRQHGVHTPVLVSQGDSYDGSPSYELQHGHHRVYSSADIDPHREIPLVHTYSRNSGARREPANKAAVQSASHISMGEDYVEGAWKDPTVQPRHFLLT